MFSKKAAPPWIAAALFAAPAWGQSPPYDLQPGTYNAPAGVGAYSPTVPLGPSSGPSSMPGQPFGQATIFPQNLLNSDILNSNQAIWRQRLQQQSARQEVLPTREDKVVISVKLPQADAQLWVDGQATKQKGAERVFMTPPLQPGKYKYELRASWAANKTPVVASRTVIFQPGEDLAIDFSGDP